MRKRHMSQIAKLMACFTALSLVNCSLFFMRPVPPLYARDIAGRPLGHCTESYVPPIIDTVLASAALFAVGACAVGVVHPEYFIDTSKQTAQTASFDGIIFFDLGIFAALAAIPMVISPIIGYGRAADCRQRNANFLSSPVPADGPMSLPLRGAPP